MIIIAQNALTLFFAPVVLRTVRARRSDVRSGRDNQEATMTDSKNGKTIALVVIIVVLALFALQVGRSSCCPFGVVPGLHPLGRGGRTLDQRVLPRIRVDRPVRPVPPSRPRFIILWGALLIWVYRDAEKRGMSGILWLLLVLIGNVIGLLIYAIVRSETPVKRRGRSACGATGEMSGLRETLSAGYVFCPHCGRNLTRTCPACGKPVEGSWKACPACGAGLDPGEIRQA
ncbi:MAG: zinc ribbon domain-containing protein [Candidatus Moduliflexus flocculans]|nr:zinc ribbon domain-containing protein [Candidatus Moduliflexus flocculans]